MVVKQKDFFISKTKFDNQTKEKIHGNLNVNDPFGWLSGYGEIETKYNLYSGSI